MPVLVRNTEAGPTVFSIPENNIQIEWQGAGDPGGGDVQPIPDILAENVQFTKMLRRGLFTIETDDAALDLQAEAHQQKRDAATASAAATLDPEVNNDLIQAECVGPAARGTGTCGKPVPVREKTQFEKPILCPQHAGLAPEFALLEEDGKPVWKRSTLAPRERQQNDAK
jgi:hypothetical protein